MTEPFADERQPRRTRAVTIGVGSFALLLAAYVALAAYVSGKVPADTTVGGIKVGSMSVDRARAAVKEGVHTRATTPVTITAGSKKTQIKPADAGLAIDVDGSVDGLTGFSLNPVRIYGHLFGGVDHPLELDIDQAKLGTAVTKAAAAVKVAPKEGSLAVKSGKVALVAPVTGQQLVVDEAVSKIESVWPAQSAVTAPVTKDAPKVSAQELQRAKTELADKAVSGPVQIKAGSKSFSLSPAAFSPALSYPADAKGVISQKINAQALTTIVLDAADEAGVTVKAKDASVNYVNGQPTVVPSRAGSSLAKDKIAPAVTAALTSPARTATIPVTSTEPKFTTERARATLPKGQISTFTTRFAADGGGRVTNIRIAARTLDGTYVPPGGTLSLNGILGQRTPEKGYQKGGVISGGRLRENYGGGISQVSTTLFNAAFFAGMEFKEYMAHGFYISRYPEGREATISWPDVDQKWVNTTDGGVYIRAYSTGGQITVTFMGTKKWDITATKGPRRNIVPYRTLTDNSPGCITQMPTPGFDVTVTRVFKQGGSVVRTQNFNTHYIPEDNVRCTHPNAK